MVDFSRTESEVALGIARERPVCLKFGDCTRDSNAVFEESDLARVQACETLCAHRSENREDQKFSRFSVLSRSSGQAWTVSARPILRRLCALSYARWCSDVEFAKPGNAGCRGFSSRAKLYVIQPEPLEYLHPFVVPIFCHLQPFSPVHRGSRKGYRKRGFFAGKDTTQVKYYVGA